MDALHQLPIPLLEWYRDNARTLPWREEPTPYHVWVSEIMLQQTRVAAVLGYYARFLEQAPDVAALAALPEGQLMKLWQGLGYYNRARNLQAAARQIMEEHGGVFPSDYQAVRRLKGVGEYTAGAICSIAFGQPRPAVDGNVLRVVARITGDDGDITTPAMKQRVTQRLEEVYPLQAAGDFTQALMELGATVCVPNGAPHCDCCPAQGFCLAHCTGREGELPVKAPKKERRVEERTVWILYRRGRVALRQRPGRGLLAGLWEFPHELGAWEQPPQAWGLDTGRWDYGGQAKHIFTHIEWRMTLRTAQVNQETLPQGWVWADSTARQEAYAIPNAFAGALRLLERMEEQGEGGLA